MKEFTRDFQKLSGLIESTDMEINYLDADSQYRKMTRRTFHPKTDRKV